MKNRSEIEVIASILNAATTNWEYKTTIMNNAAVSHSQLIRYLAIAVERGLVEYSEVRDLYKTTEAGLLFLDKYAHLLRLLPKNADLPDLISSEKEEEDSIVSEPIRNKNI
jgi:predicted transcriptional regulator